MNMQHVTVAVTGAAGQIGYALLFRIASGQMFGPHVEVTLRLIEVPAAVSALQGVIMELEDCAFPLLREVTATADLAEGFHQVDWALLVGAAPRKDGMERSDLLKINGGIFKAQGEALNQYAAENVRIFVVGNPCNTNALIAMHHAPRIPRENFYAMTMLDQNRARTQLAKKAGVPLTAVKQIAIFGNHSSTQFPDFYHATIHGHPLTEVITDSQWLQEDFIPMIQKRGAAVIKARGGVSSAASAANAVVDGVHALVNDTPVDEVISVALCTPRHQPYGVPAGLIFSFPCRVVAGKLHIVENWTHNAFGQQQLQLTIDELRHEYETVKTLGLI